MACLYCKYRGDIVHLLQYRCLPGAHHSLHVTTVNFLRLECSVLVGRMALSVRMTNGFSHLSKSIFLCYFLDINR